MISFLNAFVSGTASFDISSFGNIHNDLTQPGLGRVVTYVSLGIRGNQTDILA